MPVRIALPKGRLLRKTAALLQRADWGLDEYTSRISFYRPKSPRFPDLQIKVLHEKDIPIQLAVGNYDLGICSRDWVEELLVKYPSSAVVKVQDLGYGYTTLCAVSKLNLADYVSRILNRDFNVRIVSEYPNLAESFALKQRLGRFRVFPVWGAAEAYPPENADMALINVKSADELTGMTEVMKFFDSSAYLIANRNSWEQKDLGEIVDSICRQIANEEKPAAIPAMRFTQPEGSPLQFVVPEGQKELPVDVLLKGMVKINKPDSSDAVWIALPDGHQQQFTIDLLRKAGIQISDYPSETGNRRPDIKMDGVNVKVVRPQDMPLQVANGSFDLAITGRDWVREHLNQFPSSPVKELLNLGFGKVRMVAVVGNEVAANDVAGLREIVERAERPLRVASEYVQIADRYARENHLSPYRVIPTWGATEAFLPDDADLLIENTETGRTIARHNLKIIDTLFESTACLIGNEAPITSRKKKERVRSLIAKFKAAMEA
ncbi:MAG: ATP phosphoribosyltransferase [Dehalococcoidales bacterium]|nr:ATP phosphoribosyltransferase [Dehalococcoidales bacterium]